MNHANLRKLRDHLAALDPARFGMGSYFSLPDGDWANWLGAVPESQRCGTVACIAGHAQLIGAEDQADRDLFASDFAQDWLGLDADEASRLFMGGFSGKVTVERCEYRGLETVTLDEAVAELDRMLATSR